jgi:hypothetical protein
MTHDLSDLTDSSVSRPIQVPMFDIGGARTPTDSRWHDGHPAGAIELSDTELREALKAKPICSENASISTTWCNNPNVC